MYGKPRPHLPGRSQESAIFQLRSGSLTFACGGSSVRDCTEEVPRRYRLCVPALHRMSAFFSMCVSWFRQVADSLSVPARQTIGLLIAAIVVNATKDYDNASCYQIPIGIQVRELPAPLWTIHACSRLGETFPFLGRVEQAIDAFGATSAVCLGCHPRRRALCPPRVAAVARPQGPRRESAPLARAPVPPPRRIARRRRRTRQHCRFGSARAGPRIRHLCRAPLEIEPAALAASCLVSAFDGLPLMSSTADTRFRMQDRYRVPGASATVYVLAEFETIPARD